MAAIQGLTVAASAIIDGMKLRKVHKMLRDLYGPRQRAILDILKDGPKHCTEIQRLMYKRGDTTISQDQVSQYMGILNRYRLIHRVYHAEFLPKYHYYALNEHRITELNRILIGFSNPAKVSDDTIAI